MNTKIEILAFLSLTVNLLILCLGSWAVQKKGGLSYLIRKLSSIKATFYRNKKDSYNSFYYRHKSSQFQILPKPGSGSKILFLGDSLTDECEWIELFADLRIGNRGISGDTTDGILARLAQVTEYHPEKIFLLIGINDLLNEGKSPLEISQNYRIILSNIQRDAPATQVFIQSVLPVNSQVYGVPLASSKVLELNFDLQELAKEFSFPYIDLFTHLSDSQDQLDAQYTLDGVHLNGSAYSVWKNVIQKYVE